jgi:hypothetical protein
MVTFQFFLKYSTQGKNRTPGNLYKKQSKTGA